MGQEQARSLLTRVGYAAGARDAELVSKMWPDSDPANAFHAGPRMHKLQGVVRPVPNSSHWRKTANGPQRRSTQSCPPVTMYGDVGVFDNGFK